MSPKPEAPPRTSDEPDNRRRPEPTNKIVEMPERPSDRDPKDEADPEVRAASELPEEPLEEPQKPYRQILLNELNTGLEEFHRPSLGLLLSSLSGGLDVSFSLLLMAAMRTVVRHDFSQALTTLLVANMYAIGFIFVVVGRSELFTEHTSRAMFPVMSGYAGWGSLARLWTLVYLGNMAGVMAFSALLAYAGPPLKIIDSVGFAAMSRPLLERTWLLTLIAAGLAGWLMGLLAWLVSACRDTVSQIVIVWIVTSAIGLVGLPHAIVGAGEVLVSVFAGQDTTWGEFFPFLLWTTIGNGLGGIIFVAGLKYSHSTRGSESSETAGV
ncbi:MAG TPA: formate/nitrite transporter family protein [Pirellulales bacterium]|jgi:formate/nitrite transporter FocA (FNT family)|nr:formate/nitrite transporter family protein [Pirellulales bacterium]